MRGQLAFLGLGFAQHHIVQADSPRLLRPAQLEDDLGRIALGCREDRRKLFLPCPGLGTEVCLWRPRFGIALDRHRKRVHICGLEHHCQAIGFAGIKLQIVETEQAVPGVTARLDLGTELAAFARQSNAASRPEAVLPLFKGAIGNHVCSSGLRWKTDEKRKHQAGCKFWQDLYPERVLRERGATLLQTG